MPPDGSSPSSAPERCPGCGVPVGAVAVTLWVTPAARARLRDHLDVVRREAGLATVGDAACYAARKAALELHRRV